MKILVSAFIATLILFGALAFALGIPPVQPGSPVAVQSANTMVYVEPQNGTVAVGAFYTISVKIADVTSLWGFDIQIRWGTAVLKYVSHTSTAGQVGGVLNSPVYVLKDEVDETASMTDSAAGTTYWYAAVSFGGASAFNGSGIAFTMTFQVLRDGECDVCFTKVDLADNSLPAQPIFHVVEDAYFYRPGLGNVPVADFTFTPDPVVATKTTTFDASGSYDPDSGGSISLYIWNFKDGIIVNTTSPMINHNFTTIPYAGYYDVELTVLDDQGAGSQSKPFIAQVTVVHPRPVARFTVWPEDCIAVVNKTVTFDASDSYDPDPGGSILEYRWNFGDGNLTNTSNPDVTHKFETTDEAGFWVRLVVVDDSDGLESLEVYQFIIVVERRDIDVVDATASPSTVMQGKNVTIDVTIANRGEADEDFTLAAYHNTTMTDWIKVDETSVSNLPKQYIPRLEFINRTSLNSTAYHTLREMYIGAFPVRDDTKVLVDGNTGYWAINPGILNTAVASPTLASGTPLTTGGWIWEDYGMGIPTGAKKLNGDFAAGDWMFRLKLYANQAGVNATVWVRILKSDTSDPQAHGALITVINDWTSVFTARELATTASIINGAVSVPSAVFAAEYLFCEFQLQVTENTAGSATTVVFQIGGLSESAKPYITATPFRCRARYTLSWNTEAAPAGNHVVKIVANDVPHETNTTNNEDYSDAVTIVSVGHDLAVTGIDTAKTIVGQGFTLSINVTVRNYGSFLETFNITAYANLTAIGTIETTLPGGTSTTVTLTWATTPFAKGHYHLIASAEPVEEDLDPDDNTLMDGWAFVTFPGDADGDRDVDIFDIVRMAGVYGVKLPDPRYQPNCDIDGDGDIDIFDIVIAAGHYGDSW